jgi:hypothetical protein
VYDLPSYHRRQLCPIALAACISVLGCLPAPAQNAFPRLLPPAESYRLTLREQPRSKLPLGPSCTGEAAMTLTCSAFRFTLQNRSRQTVRLASDCGEPRLMIERKEPNSSSGWSPVSKRLGCPTVEWKNIRLKPGESTVFETRLISPTREGEPFLPGSYTLRAMVTLLGCTETEKDKGTDCLDPLEATPKPPSTAYQIDFQEPVTVISNEIVAKSSRLPDLGRMSLGFNVEISSASPSSERMRMGCTSGNETGIDCRIFKFWIVNSGTRPVRYITTSCSNSGLVPEYLDAADQWTALPQRFWSCGMNILVQTPILPGKAIEGEFTLKNLAPGWDTTPLRGLHRVRFRLFPAACFASPDGRFCLTNAETQPSVISSEILVP